MGVAASPTNADAETERRTAEREKNRLAHGARMDAMSLRLRFAGYVVLVVLLPLAVGAWAMGKQAADNKFQQADVTMQPQLRAAVTEFGDQAAKAQKQLETLAGRPAIITALELRNKAALQRYVDTNPTVAFFYNAGPESYIYNQHATAPAFQSDVDVYAGGKNIGRIYVSLPYDQKLLAALRAAGHIRTPDRLALQRPNGIIGGPQSLGALHGTVREPQNIRLGDTTYRVLAGKVPSDTGTNLVVFRPKATLDSAITRAKLRIYLAALALLAAVGLLAYLLAPKLARGRLLQQQRAQAARVLSEVGDGVFLLDPDGKVRLWNPAAETITGIAAEDAFGRPIDELLPAWQTIGPLIPVSSQRSANGDRGSVKTVPLEIQGRELWLSFSGADFAEGRVYTFRDLSEERRIEELKMDFVASVSHELRTPLSAITGASVTLRERAAALPEATRRQLLAVISEQSARLAALIDDILLAGQLAYGRVAVADEAFAPVDLAEAVIDEMRATVGDHHAIELVAADDVPEAAGDSAKARQVLVNLIENAAKYSPDGGEVQVRVDADDRHARFSVRDEGLGISKKEQERIFEKFYRVDPLMKQGISGTGLGLYICRELVQHMGGRIWVTSTPGVGSTFSFELPLAAERERERSWSEREAVEAHRSRRRALV